MDNVICLLDVYPKTNCHGRQDDDPKTGLRLKGLYALLATSAITRGSRGIAIDDVTFTSMKISSSGCLLKTAVEAHVQAQGTEPKGFFNCSTLDQNGEFVNNVRWLKDFAFADFRLPQLPFLGLLLIYLK